MENQGKRLNKFVADSGYCSRREADRLIVEGRVQVDGRPGALGDRVLPGMRVTVDEIVRALAPELPDALAPKLRKLLAVDGVPDRFLSLKNEH